MNKLIKEYIGSKEKNKTNKTNPNGGFLGKLLRIIVRPISKWNVFVNKDEEENNRIDYKVLFENTNKKLNELTSKLKKANEQLRQEKDKNIKLKNNNFSYLEDAKTLREDNDNFKKEIKDLSSKYETLGKALEAKTNELTELNTFKAKFNKLLTSNLKFRAKNETYRQQIRVLKTKLI